MLRLQHISFSFSRDVGLELCDALTSIDLGGRRSVGFMGANLNSNVDIFYRKEKGESTASLARDYGISTARATHIYESERGRRSVLWRIPLKIPDVRRRRNYKAGLEMVMSTGRRRNLRVKGMGEKTLPLLLAIQKYLASDHVNDGEVRM